MKKHFPRVSALVALGVVTALAPARANVLGDLGRSIAGLWQQKVTQQSAARATLSKATATKKRAEFLEERLEKTARLLAVANSDYENYAAQLAQTEARIVRARHRVQISTARYENHRQQFGARLAALQKHGEPSLLSVVLGSDSLADLTRRTNFVRALSEHDSRLQADLKADRLEMARAQNALMEQWQAREKLARATHDERARIAQGQREQAAIWRRVNSSKVAYLQLAAAQQRASNQIGAQIQSLQSRKAQIIAAYDAQSAPRPISRRARSGRTIQTAFESDESYQSAGNGAWITPARGRISSRFGFRYHPILHREKLHTGEDIAAGYGTAFRAARGGRVLYAGWQTAYGNTIIIDNGNGTTTLYGHASKLNVRAGQPVKAGQFIGNVGSTGWSTGPHLHFEVRKNGKPVDPSRFVG